MRSSLRLTVLILALCLSFGVVSADAFHPDTDAVYLGELDSKLMNRKMPYNVYGPVGYQKQGKEKLPVIYLLHGLTGSFSNWFANGNIEDAVKKHGIIVVMPEGNNGWYTDSPVKADDKYESYIIEELIPEIEKSFPVRSDRNGRAIAGLSMGGYGGLKFGLKHPEKFVLAGSFSGALRAAEWDDKTVPAFRVLGTSVMSAFGVQGSETRASNDIYKLAGGMSEDQIKDLPFLYLDCGTEDGLISQNREFAELLMTKKAPHEFRQLPGRHDWKYWRSQIGEFFEVSDRFLKRETAAAASK